MLVVLGFRILLTKAVTELTPSLRQLLLLVVEAVVVEIYLLLQTEEVVAQVVALALYGMAVILHIMAEAGPAVRATLEVTDITSLRRQRLLAAAAAAQAQQELMELLPKAEMAGLD